MQQTDDLTRRALAMVANVTGGLSPQAFAGAWFTVLGRLATSPGRQAELARQVLTKSVAMAQFAGGALGGRAPEAEGTPYASRFSGPEWSKFPFNLLAQSFLTVSGVAREAVREVPGMDAESEGRVGFTLREGLEIFAPDNYLPTNPRLIEQTVQEHGRNLLRGVSHLAQDVKRTFRHEGPTGIEQYRVGEHIAVSPGKVILRNGLMELIQYSPQTEKVHPEPVLIVPAWIMKYYILDLSPRNSLVKYLTGLGHTVFMISWKNPEVADRELTMDDYLTQGVLAALDAVNAVVPKRKVHAPAIASAAPCSRRLTGAALHDRLASSRLSRHKPISRRRLGVFISKSQVAMLQAQMWKHGVLDSKQMGAAFQLLRAYDLLWSPAISTYVKGERTGLNDLMAWNADGTRMAWRMHSDYLRQLYPNNDLAERRYVALGHELNLADITVPAFVVGTETDHVAPWRSVYKVGRLIRSSDYTFCLTSGGHNAGIISGPEHPKRRHRVRTTKAGVRLLSAEKFLETVEPAQGSWWPTWAKWLKTHSSARKVPPPAMGAAKKGYKRLDDAPGTYVHAK
jgi:polyhydroxyalkanoate synthase